MKRILLSPDADIGGSPDPASIPPVSTDAPPSAPPPAAHTVVTGTKNERELQLEKELAETRGKLSTVEEEKKKRELALMDLQDQNRRLKEVPTSEKKKGSGLRLTLMEDDDE